MKVEEWTILPEISLFHGSDVLTSNWTFGIASGPNRCQAPGATPGDASKQEAQTGARHQVRRQVDASKQGARIGARHRVRRQVDASKQEAQTGARHRVQRQGLPQMALNSCKAEVHKHSSE